MFLKLFRIALALAVMAAPVMAQPFTINGSVTYRERIALPPGAQLHVSLVRLPGAVPVVGATATIPARGQVPLAFSLNVRSDLADGDYGIVAEIRQAGTTLFRNSPPAPVDVFGGTPADILVRPAPPSLSPPPPITPPLLTDIVWTVTSIGGKPVTGTRPITLSIAADQRAGGSGGCNNYFAEASIGDDKIVFGPAAATQMACAENIMAQEQAYFAALAAVASLQTDGESLRLLDAAGVPLVGLVRMKE